MDWAGDLPEKSPGVRAGIQNLPDLLAGSGLEHARVSHQEWIGSTDEVQVLGEVVNLSMSESDSGWEWKIGLSEEVS